MNPFTITIDHGKSNSIAYSICSGCDKVVPDTEDMVAIEEYNESTNELIVLTYACNEKCANFYIFKKLNKND